MSIELENLLRNVIWLMLARRGTGVAFSPRESAIMSAR